jgi:hypothetical protein
MHRNGRNRGIKFEGAPAPHNPIAPPGNPDLVTLRDAKRTAPPERNMIARRRWYFRGQAQPARTGRRPEMKKPYMNRMRGESEGRRRHMPALPIRSYHAPTESPHPSLVNASHLLGFGPENLRKISAPIDGPDDICLSDLEPLFVCSRGCVHKSLAGRCECNRNAPINAWKIEFYSGLDKPPHKADQVRLPNAH